MNAAPWRYVTIMFNTALPTTAAVTSAPAQGPRSTTTMINENDASSRGQGPSPTGLAIRLTTTIAVGTQPTRGRLRQ